MIMVIKNDLTFKSVCNVLKKAIYKITLNFRWNFKQIWRSLHTLESKCGIEGFENNEVWVAC